MLDVLVIGGSYAGLSAALQLARARRQVGVVDAGLRRNRFASHSHGFLGQDGRTPAAIIADARDQLLAYPNVRWIDGTADRAVRDGDAFAVTAVDSTIAARRIILALGVADTLPPIPGLTERWGRSVFHCPYCHGYELNQGRLGVLATSPHAVEQAMMIPDWGRTTLFLNGTTPPDAETASRLEKRGVTIETAQVAGVGETANVVLADGRVVPLDGLFVQPLSQPSTPIATDLGCEAELAGLVTHIRTDGFKETSVTGVFACGDAARPFGSVAMAVADGAMAGVATHRSLIMREC